MHSAVNARQKARVLKQKTRFDYKTLPDYDVCLVYGQKLFERRFLHLEIILDAFLNSCSSLLLQEYKGDMTLMLSII